MPCSICDNIVAAFGKNKELSQKEQWLNASRSCCEPRPSLSMTHDIMVHKLVPIPKRSKSLKQKQQWTDKQRKAKQTSVKLQFPKRSKKYCMLMVTLLSSSAMAARHLWHRANLRLSFLT